MKSQRQLQMGENIKRVISEMFLRNDLLIFPGNYITILEADVSPDAKNVRIYIDIFGGSENEHKKIVEKLNLSAPSFRYQLAKKVVLRVVPEISFIHDKTQQNAMNLSALIEDEAKKYAEPKKKARKSPASTSKGKSKK